jgi:coenzyme F420-reducing hydrogenase delta subunit
MIQVELKPEVEARLVADALANGVEPAVYAGAVIERAYHPDNGSRKASRSPQEVRAWLDSLAQFSDKIPQLPEEAFKRESFYQEKRVDADRRLSRGYEYSLAYRQAFRS